MNFYEQYTTYSDTRIFEILKNHKNYQEAAVDAAVKIAVERKLINSDQDLMSPEFQNGKSSGFSIFPEITSDYHRQRLVGSIFRFLFLVSLLPFIYGILNYSKGETTQTWVGVGVGFTWFLFCFLLKKTQKSVFFILLLLLILSVSVLIGNNLIEKETTKLLDFVMLVIGVLLPVYLLVYQKKLIRQI